MDKEELINKLNEIIVRSENWMNDSEKRDDWNDYYFYEGQKKLAEELKNITSK